MIKRWLRTGGTIALILVAYLNAGYLTAVVWWKWFDPVNTAFMEAGLTRLQARNPKAKLHYRWVSYGWISINLKRAVVAAEDSRFMEHDGFDWKGMQEAAEKYLDKGRIVAGGSTISQQLAKNLFLSASRSPLRKLEEAVLTVMLEQIWGKRRILEVYLNVIEWGNGIYGAGAAARHYFGTSAARLDADQSALLAAMIPDPEYYENHLWARGLRRRQGIILARMRQVSVPR